MPKTTFLPLILITYLISCREESPQFSEISQEEALYQEDSILKPSPQKAPDTAQNEEDERKTKPTSSKKPSTQSNNSPTSPATSIDDLEETTDIVEELQQTTTLDPEIEISKLATSLPKKLTIEITEIPNTNFYLDNSCTYSLPQPSDDTIEITAENYETIMIYKQPDSDCLPAIALTIISPETVCEADPKILRGSGSKEDEFIICTHNQLYNIRAQMDKHYVLGQDLDLNFYQSSWKALGHTTTSDTPFTGSLNGRNHTIKNLKISSGEHQGLFVQLGDETQTATIKNLILGEKKTSDSPCCDIRTTNNGGSLAAIANNAILKNITNHLSVKASSSSGGIIGIVTGDITAENLENTANVHSGENAGGIIGTIETNSSQELALNKLGNTGKVSGLYTGGIIGKIESGTLNLTNTLNNALINSRQDSGGIVGYNNAYLIINTAHNKAEVTSQRGGSGGIIGYNNGDFTLKTILNSGQIHGFGKAGGIVGHSNQQLNSGLKLTEVNNTAKVTSSGNSGGIFGSAGGAAETILSAMQVANSGTVTGDTNAGGFAGLSNNIKFTIDGFKNTGTLSGNTSYYLGYINSYNTEKSSFALDHNENLSNLQDLTSTTPTTNTTTPAWPWLNNNDFPWNID